MGFITFISLNEKMDLSWSFLHHSPSPSVTTPLNNDHTVMWRQITNLQTKFIKQNLENAFKTDHELATCDVNFTGSSGPLP